MQTKIEVFFSYAHKDISLQTKLEAHLSTLKRQGLIVDWHDRNINAGTDWTHEIDVHLNSAQIILLLISPDFIASEYCYSNEMKRAMERYETGETHVIPVILRPTDLKGTPFSKLQTLPSNAKPVTRWQNRDEAFLNITEGIRKVIEKLTLKSLVVPTPLSSIWNVPYRRNPFFTGREDVLAYLEAVLPKDKTATLTQPQAINGLGGIGKTQCAVEYAYRHRADYDCVFWVRAEKREELISDYADIASLLQLPQKDEQDQSLTVEAVKHWLETHTGWLLILDNADDLTMANDFLPKNGSGHILLTTRSQVVGEIGQNVEIQKMEPDEGALLLLRRAKIINRTSTTHRAIAMNIVKVMDGLPLALDQAGAYIEETGCSLSNYLVYYEKQRAELLNRRGGLVPDHPEPVAITWSLSFQKVKQANPAATDLLRLCAFLSPDAIAEEILLEGASALIRSLQLIATDPLKLNEMIGELRKYSLIYRNPDQTLSIHRLVQAVLKDTMDKRTKCKWAEYAVRSVNHVFPDAKIKTLSKCQRYILHAQTCAALINEWNMAFTEAQQLLYKAGRYLEIRAQYIQAEPLCQKLLEVREQTLGPDHSDVVECLVWLEPVRDSSWKPC